MKTGLRFSLSINSFKALVTFSETSFQALTTLACLSESVNKPFSNWRSYLSTNFSVSAIHLCLSANGDGSSSLEVSAEISAIETVIPETVENSKPKCLISSKIWDVCSALYLENNSPINNSICFFPNGLFNGRAAITSLMLVPILTKSLSAHILALLAKMVLSSFPDLKSTKLTYGKSDGKMLLKIILPGVVIK